MSTPVERNVNTNRQKDGDKANKSFLKRYGWTLEDIKDFQHVWTMLVHDRNDDRSNLGIAFLIWIIENIPDAKTMFEVYDITDPRYLRRTSSMTGSKFMGHANAIALELDTLINGLQDPELGLHLIKELLRMHHARGIGLQHFQMVRDRIHRFLYDMAGCKRQTRESILWYRFMDVIVTIHEEQFGEGGRKQNPGPRRRCCCVS